MSDQEAELLIERESYLSQGVHLGTRSQHQDMEDYIFHVKKNQLAVLNLEKTDEQIRNAAEFLSEYNPEDVLVVGRKEEAYRPINKFVEATGFEKIAGRFVPGTLTNPSSEGFMEPEVVMVTDPEEDAQAIEEAADINVPVVAIADSENNLDNVDVVVPANNKSESSLGLVLYLIADEILDDLQTEPEEFGVKEEEEEEDTEETETDQEEPEEEEEEDE